MEQEKNTPDQAMIVASKKHYSEEGLWEKVKNVAKKAGLQVVYLVLVLYYTAIADSTPSAKKGIIYGALGYFILPLDLVPDAIPVVGFSDDLAALLWCVATVASSLTPEIKSQAEAKLTDWFGDIDKSELKGLIK